MIRLRLETKLATRLSLEGVLPERLAGLDADAVRATPLHYGNRCVALAELFSVAAVGPGDLLEIEADDARLDEIGAGMSAGEIRVTGSVGAALGRGMGGGRIAVEGSAGADAAMVMHGGELRIAGNAGDRLGGAIPGERLGMSGGTVVVGGNAGGAVGDRLRRGLVVIVGDAGPLCGARMTAGTIVVGGRLGRHPGVAMRRGSLVALGGLAGEAPASFAWSGRHELAFARLLGRSLAGTGLDAMLPRLQRLERWVGDLATGGKGEILAPA